MAIKPVSELIENHQDLYVYKTSEQIGADIVEKAELGLKEIFYDKKVLSEEVIQELVDAGYWVEPYTDEHTEAKYMQLMRISWDLDNTPDVENLPEEVVDEPEAENLPETPDEPTAENLPELPTEEEPVKEDC